MGQRCDRTHMVMFPGCPYCALDSMTEHLSRLEEEVARLKEIEADNRIRLDERRKMVEELREENRERYKDMLRKEEG